jgi:tetratricopeptide (TPR) repeat protein
MLPVHHPGEMAGRRLGSGTQRTKKPTFSRGRFVEMRRSTTGDNEDGFRDGFCRAHPLLSWRMDGKIVKIISGGQTGADRAALDFAIERGIPHGGWCPKGRRAEDGPIDTRYQLKETSSADYIQRTEWNQSAQRGRAESIQGAGGGGIRPGGSGQNMAINMKPLQPPDIHHLRAAIGWLELGNHTEANEELEKITPALRAHSNVLEIRLQIYAKAGKWGMVVEIGNALVRAVPKSPYGWLHRSIALHQLKRTQEAFDQLLPVADKFPKVWTIPYNLACYCAQTGRLEECKKWFKMAMNIAENMVKRAAIDDPDLKPLWDGMGGTVWRRTE